MKSLASIIIAIAALFGCKKQETVTASATVAPPTVIKVDTSKKYLALGDSYTIGQSVQADLSFPFQLTNQLRNNKFVVADPVIIAQTGWTTTNLKRAISAAAITKKFDFVTLLIGVNNQFQKGDPEKYRADFIELVNTAIIYADGNRKHVFVLSIPDYSVTPFAAGYDTVSIKTEINQYNAINKVESKRLAVNYLNITDISRQAKTDNSLIAADGLHPSDLMYRLWVQQLLKQVMDNLK